MSEPYVLWQNGQNMIQLKAQGFTTAQLIASFSKLHIPPPSPEISMSLGIIQHVPATDQNTWWNEIGDGFYVVVFTSEWQERDLDESILKGVNGFEDAQIVTVKSADLKKVCKKAN